MVLACQPYYAFERTKSAETIVQPKREREGETLFTWKMDIAI